MSIGQNKLKICTKSGVDVGVASTALMAANPRRLYAEIVNSSNEGVWINFGAAAVMNEGIYIAPNGYSYQIKPENLWQGTIFGICASGGKRVGIVEFQ